MAEHSKYQSHIERKRTSLYLIYIGVSLFFIQHSIPWKILNTSIISPLILLISSVVRLSLLSLVSYGSSLNVGINLVNRLCTPSISLTCLN